MVFEGDVYWVFGTIDEAVGMYNDCFWRERGLERMFAWDDRGRTERRKTPPLLRSRGFVIAYRIDVLTSIMILTSRTYSNLHQSLPLRLILHSTRTVKTAAGHDNPGLSDYQAWRLNPNHNPRLVSILFQSQRLTDPW